MGFFKKAKSVAKKVAPFGGTFGLGMGFDLGGQGSPVSWLDEFFTSREQRAAEERIAGQNLQFQRDNLAYQQAIQQMIFQREDNSMQRRVEDLRNAGLSPVLAAGGGGSSAGSVVGTTAPMKEMPRTQKNVLGKVIQAFQIANMYQGLLQTSAQIALTQQQKAESETKSFQNLEQGKKASQEGQAIGYDLGIAQRSGTRYNSSAVGKTTSELWETWLRTQEDVGKRWKGLKNDIKDMFKSPEQPKIKVKPDYEMKNKVNRSINEVNKFLKDYFHESDKNYKKNKRR